MTKKIIVILNKLFGKFIFKKPVIVIEIGNDCLKILENNWGINGRYIANIRLIKFVDIKEASSIISAVFKELKLNKQRVFTYIPRNLVTVRVLELPSTDIKEIDEIIGLQVGKQTPYAKEEIISAYKILETNKQGYTKALLFIVKRDIITERIEILRKNGIGVEKLTVSSEGAYNWFDFAHMPEISVEEPRTVVLLDIDSAYSDFIIIHKKKLAFTRNILIGANHIFVEEKILTEKFIEELKYSIEAYQQEEGNNKVDKIFLSGADLYSDKLSYALSAGLNIPVSAAAIMKNIRVNSRGDILAGDKLKFISITALLGVAVRHKDLEIDLVPGELRIKKLVETKRRDLTVMGALFISMVMTVSLLFLIRVYNKNVYIEQLKQKILAIKKESDEVEKIRLNIDLIEKRKGAKNSSLNILGGIYSLIPDEVFLNSVDIEEKNKVILKGAAVSLSDVFKLVTKLENSPYFMNVKNTYSTSKREKDVEYTDFEIAGIIEGSQK